MPVNTRYILLLTFGHSAYAATVPLDSRRVLDTVRLCPSRRLEQLLPLCEHQGRCHTWQIFEMSSLGSSTGFLSHYCRASHWKA